MESDDLLDLYATHLCNVGVLAMALAQRDTFIRSRLKVLLRLEAQFWYSFMLGPSFEILVQNLLPNRLRPVIHT